MTPDAAMQRFGTDPASWGGRLLRKLCYIYGADSRAPLMPSPDAFRALLAGVAEVERCDFRDVLAAVGMAARPILDAPAAALDAAGLPLRDRTLRELVAVLAFEIATGRSTADLDILQNPEKYRAAARAVDSLGKSTGAGAPPASARQGRAGAERPRKNELGRVLK